MIRAPTDIHSLAPSTVVVARTGHASSGSLMAQPLTRQLTTDTPLRRWFGLRFGNLDAVASDLPLRLRSLVPRRRPDAIPPWLMGMAFDWRLRLGLDVPEDPGRTTAFAGWLLAFGDHPASFGGAHRGRWCDPVTLLLDRARANGAGDTGPAMRAELELARISIALARYESWYRGGVRPDDPLHQLGSRPELAAIESLYPAAAAEQLVRLIAVARRGLAPLFPASDIETNPVFDAHGIPADGDLVIDGLLLDLKTVTRPQLRVEWLWQMIGYALLDDGRRHLGSVGLYLSRHGWLHRWSLSDLLSRLAGESVTIDDAVQEFLVVVGGQRSRRSVDGQS